MSYWRSCKSRSWLQMFRASSAASPEKWLECGRLQKQPFTVLGVNKESFSFGRMGLQYPTNLLLTDVFERCSIIKPKYNTWPFPSVFWSCNPSFVSLHFLFLIFSGYWWFRFRTNLIDSPVIGRFSVQILTADLRSTPFSLPNLIPWLFSDLFSVTIKIVVAV